MTKMILLEQITLALQSLGNNEQLNKTKIMKRYIFTILAIGTALLFAACTDELENKYTTKYSGEEIVFGARATYELNEDKNKAPQTRTVYTGEFLGADGKAWQSGSKYEGVKWIADDQVRIYCPQAAGRKTADYVVALEGNEKEHVASLTRHPNYDGALQWGDTNATHDFYAVYPAPSMYDEGFSDTEVLNGNTKLVGNIPAVQPHIGYSVNEIPIVVPSHDDLPALTGSTKGKNYILAPDMKYAYMVARRSVIPAQTEENVYLNFVPVATAVEITIQNLARNNSYPNGQTLHLTNVLVNSTEPISGQFNVDLADINEDGTFTGEQDPFSNTFSTGKQVSLPMFEQGLYGDPIQLGFGDAVTFTVFMLPTAEIESLDIVVQGLGGSKSGHLNGVEIVKRKKTYIKNLPFVGENVLPFTQSEWMRFVEDDVPLKALSIPGAGGAASGEKYALGQTTDLGDYDRQQNLTIEQLWEKGIRCFELATDIPSDETSSLGGQNVICNGKSCGITLDEAIGKIAQSLNDHNQEFAMVILTYQTLGGWGARKPAVYMKLLNAYWPKVADKLGEGCSLGEYDSDATMNDSRGKLFCIARPTSIYQDYAPKGQTVPNMTTNTNWWGTNTTVSTKEATYESLKMPAPVDNIVVINGWGALKDKWQQRGYIETSHRQNNVPEGSTKPGRPFDVSTIYDHGGGVFNNNHDYDKHTINNDTWRGDLPDATYNPNPDADFEYTTSKNSNAWVQEWARVSNNSEYYINSVEKCGCLFNGGNLAKVQCWNSTYEEKVANIKDALSKAIKKDEDYAVYINSLCGYFIDKDIKSSYEPCRLTDYNVTNSQFLSSGTALSGLQGNIQSFAYTINEMFYQHLQDVTSGYVPGSMGIILMDRVGEIVGNNDASNKIPGIIVANNFQHEEETTVLSLPRNEEAFEPGDKLAAPAQRGVANDNEVSIVWR